ncbi:MAG: flagellar protein FlgN [Candidatus Eisenbacteria bacterium]|nr:flagellar protein FlgN [Candidatus Eisenbacteria bacterium]
MEAMLGDLRTLLSRQVENLRDLEAVLREQRGILAKRDVPGILESIEKQERCLERVQAIDRSRKELMTRISGELGVDPGGMTLKKLAENVDPEAGAELRSMGEAIRATLEDIGRVNRHNRRLIQNSLAFIRELLGVVGGKGPEKRTYGSSGDLEPGGALYALVDRTT